MYDLGVLMFCQYDFLPHVICTSQLQIESEERLHDYGERIRALQREKEEILSKLEDKQKDVDDLSFQLEEESISKADLEVIKWLILMLVYFLFNFLSL